MSFFKSIFNRLEAGYMIMRVADTEKIGSHIQKVDLRLIDRRVVRFPIGSYIQPMIGGCVPRAYSVAEEFADGCAIIVSLSGGGVGARFFAETEPGAVLKTYGPFDDFQYRSGTGLPKIFLATGTGVAPFVRMIKEAIRESAPSFLILGVPEEADIPYCDYFKSLGQSADLFKFVPVLSRPDRAWRGARGYLTDQFAGGRGEEYLRASDVYVCGHPAMVAGVKKMILKAGVPQKQVFIQKFG